MLLRPVLGLNGRMTGSLFSTLYQGCPLKRKVESFVEFVVGSSLKKTLNNIKEKQSLEVSRRK